MNQKNQRVLTGTRPSGKPHLGNYFGAYGPAVSLQDHYELFFFLADYHALNSGDKPEQIKDYSLDLTATMIACGLNPKKSFFYLQSSVPEVAELAWILGCSSPYGMMLRAHSFKDAQAKGVEVNMGVFNYPILMAADILLYDAGLVPVGQDQKQHLEMTRDIAVRFNNKYGEIFVVPEPLISKEVAIVPGTDGQKMSKSKNNIIPIFSSDKEWKKTINAIVTDSKGIDDIKDPNNCTIVSLYKLFASNEEVLIIKDKYSQKGFGYGHAKLELFGKMKEKFGPMRDKYFELKKHPDDLHDIIIEGSKKVRKLAVEKLNKIHKAVGVLGRKEL